MHASLTSALPYGLEGRLVEVQVDIAPGKVQFELVGLPAASVREARARVRAAIRNSQLNFPANQRLTVNLAPAGIRKEGSWLDLAIAVGVYCAETARQPPAHAAFIGELGLNGEVRHVNGILVVARALRDSGITELFVPEADAAEAALVAGITVYRCPDLHAVTEHLSGRERLAVQAPGAREANGSSLVSDDLADVQGQQAARRALEVAAAGGHHLLLSGPPGAGKTMLARCLPGILPPLNLDQAIEVAQVRSILGELPTDGPLQWERPFRAPHHGISGAGLIGGGGGIAQPGEISRAHNGVLFLDELAEFSASTLQALRQPLEDGRVSITRAGGSVSYPARFQLVAATNPCPCGWLGDPQHACRCSTSALASYSRALSGPLLDRIDLRVTVLRPRLELLAEDAGGEPSAAVRERVLAARARQIERQGKLNAALKPAELRRHAGVDSKLRGALHRWAAQRGFTARALHRAWRVALTLADLDGVAVASQNHALEALGYRLQDEVA